QFELARAPHHLIDVAAPTEIYDADRYGCEGRAVLADLHHRQVPPLVAGGTGLYLKALLHGLFEEGAPNPTIRARLRRELHDLGLPGLYQRLAELDPVTAGRLHPHDTYRILRALEVIEATGQPLSELLEAHRFRNCPFQVLKLGLTRPRAELNERIDRRVEAMLAQGLLSEVEVLLSRYSPDLKPLQSLGYRHLINFLKGEWSWDEAIELLKRDTRRYAKRQLTWFRADPEVRWFHPDQIDDLTAALQEFFGG
ncbi:MAG: tRNA (adenosine(37)-N6)-dimethylallyltransferase MiaA, partial [Deltaproteobacteria bacterium]|nr:tRNA (adenosine(37)-N6)-dimethylallyltransferase MiaA [Deltaproteobacteria bacterium]